jgi:hypothetical protein
VCPGSNWLQFARLDKSPGFILEAPLPTDAFPKDPMWCVFSKSEITVLRKSHLHENLLTFLVAMGELQKEGVASGDKAKHYERYT